MLTNVCNSAFATHNFYVVSPYAGIVKPSTGIARYTMYSSNASTVPNMWQTPTLDCTLSNASISSTIFPPNGTKNIYSLVCPSNIVSSTSFLSVPNIPMTSTKSFTIAFWIKKNAGHVGRRLQSVGVGQERRHLSLPEQLHEEFPGMLATPTPRHLHWTQIGTTSSFALISTPVLTPSPYTRTA